MTIGLETSNPMVLGALAVVAYWAPLSLFTMSELSSMASQIRRFAAF